LTLSDRLSPPGIGFGVGWAHVFPSTLFGDVLQRAEETVVTAIHALGLRNGIAFPQVIVSDDGESRVVEVAARIPGGQMADLARHAVGVDLVEVALLQAL
jgi:biotin carboxylase